MALKFLRVPSEIPNINNTDDFIGLRYSYGNQSGYVQGKGSEIDFQVSGSTFKILSGRLVIQGVECDIDANGYDIYVDSVATQRFHTVYLQVSLANMTAQIVDLYDTATFPSVDPGDDLTVNSIGTARLPLYYFMSISGEVSNVTKVVPGIPYLKEVLDGDIEVPRASESQNAKKVNDLELKQAINGRLKITDATIPYKNLISDSSVIVTNASGASHVIASGVNTAGVYEITYITDVFENQNQVPTINSGKRIVIKGPRESREFVKFDLSTYLSPSLDDVTYISGSAAIKFYFESGNLCATIESQNMGTLYSKVLGIYQIID